MRCMRAAVLPAAARAACPSTTTFAGTARHANCTGGGRVFGGRRLRCPAGSRLTVCGDGRHRNR